VVVNGLVTVLVVGGAGVVVLVVGAGMVGIGGTKLSFTQLPLTQARDIALAFSSLDPVSF